MSSNNSKGSRSWSKKGSSSGSFKRRGWLGGIGGGLVPIFAIACGVLIGMGGAYVVKRVIFGAQKKNPDVSMIEENDRVLGRSKIKHEARIRPVETAELNEPIPGVEQPDNAATEPPPAPAPRRADLLQQEPAPKPSKRKTAMPSKAFIRVPPSPRPPPTMAMLEPATPAPVAADPRQASPKLMKLKNLTYSRALFNRCAEDCLLLFRTADGGAVKAKLKKSSFTRVLSSNLVYADIDGYESIMDGDRVLVVKSIRGMPVAPSAAPAKTGERLVEVPKVEKRKDQVMTEPSSRRKSGDEAGDNSGEAVSQRSRPDGLSKAKKKNDNDTEQADEGAKEEGSSVQQGRLKRSLD